MADHLLAALSRAGVLERAAVRGRSHLRVSPRFLAHAEEAAARIPSAPHVRSDSVLEAALATWDTFQNDVRAGAAFLQEFLGERHQFGHLRPVFPVLESYARAAAPA